MNPRVSRLLVVVGLALVTWGLLARFVWLSSDVARRDGALPYGGVAFVSYLLTIGYAVYFRTYWAAPKVATGRQWSPVRRWLVTVLAVAAFGVTLGVTFPELTRSFAGRLFVQTVTFGGVAVGLVVSVSRRRMVASPKDGYRTAATAG